LRDPSGLQAMAVGVILLIVGFGDGVGYALATLTGQRSPWIFLLPVLLVPLSVYLLSHGLKAIDRVDRLLICAFGVFSAIVVLEQFLVDGDFYLAGLIQLLVFVLLAIVVCGVFGRAPDWLAAAFRRSIPPIHFFLCGYVVFTFLAWNLAKWDPSIRVVLTNATARLDYYGFRPSGFGAEPAWSAIALAASYTGIHYLAPQHRVNAFIALLVAAEALQSATAYAFLAVVVALYVVYKLRARHLLGPAIFLTAAVLTATGVSIAWWGNSQQLARGRDLLLDGAVLLQSAPVQLVIVIAFLLHEIYERRASRRTGGEVALTGVLLGLSLAVASLGIAQPNRDIQALPAVTQSPTPLATESPSPPATGSPTPVGTQSASPSVTPPSTATGPTRPSQSTTHSPTTVVAPTPAVAQPPLDRVNNIVTGRDPSAGLRVRSAGVAWAVIQRSFPAGVGYGNFRRYAVYPPDLAAFIETVDEIGRYKSDFFVLNYVAELGILGVVVVGCAGALLMRTRHALTVAFFALIVGLSGTLLLPPVLAMAAIVGLLTREQRGEAATLNS
jgi:hypothetical protein